MWHEEIKQKRIEYKAKQSDVASLCNIHPKTLSAIENGKKDCSEALKKQIEITLEKFNSKYKLYAIYDYVRVRFSTHDYEKVINSVLKMQTKFFIFEEHSFYGYKAQYVFSDIAVMISDDGDERGTLLELKGKGCRRLEYILNAQGRSWNDFFISCFALDGVFKRVDIAINDTKGILDIKELMQKAGTDECDTVFTKIQKISSAETLKQEVVDEKIGEGNTLYIGSLKSEIYFCIYEKDYEQYIKNGIRIEDADVKNRFEIRLKNERALAAVSDLIEYEDIEKTAFGIINRYLCFYDKDDSIKTEKWKVNPRWAWFIGSGREPVKLTMQPERYSIEKTQRWVVNQVAPSLSLLDKIDKYEGTTLVDDIRKLKLPDKQRKIYEQYTASVYDVILQDDCIADKNEIKIPERNEQFNEKFKLEKQLQLAYKELRERNEEIVMLRKRLNIDDYFI